jgi:hypothetical protein
MKLLMLSIFIFALLSACSNFKEDLKSTGDAVQTGAQNAAEAAKQVPADLSKAMNKVEDDVRK